MARPRTDFPPIRACLFDMDGLLINSEDILTLCHNTLLSTYNVGPMTWDIKSQLQGRPESEAILHLLSFYDLSYVVSPKSYAAALRKIQEREFPNAQALPGVEILLQNLKSASNSENDRKIQVALATSSHEWHFNQKTQHLKNLGEGKLSPDIYLVALGAINETLEEGEEKIKPEECLVFEDGVPDVIAGRRAGMRVVWVPHPGLAQEFKGREAEVLAGRGERGEIVDEHRLRQVGDGWGEQLVSLVDFPYEWYGIVPGK